MTKRWAPKSLADLEAESSMDQRATPPMSHLSTEKFVPVLPPELWLRIFRIATTSLVSYKLYEIEYSPFHDPPGEEDRTTLQDARRTMCSLVLVCKHWRVLAVEFLFENVHINSGSRGLLAGLVRAAQERGEGYWRRIRRVEFPILGINGPASTAVPVDIFRWSPNIEILVKFDDDLLPRSCLTGGLAHLKRFDWWYAWQRNRGRGYDLEWETPSLGLDFLIRVVTRAPNLQYLCIGRRFSTTATISHTPYTITLKFLTTLRVEHLDMRMREELERWRLPSLTHIVMDSCLIWHTASNILSQHKIRVVELLADNQFIENELITSLVRICSELQELNYYIEFVTPSRNPFQISSIRRVGLHAKQGVVLRGWGAFQDVWEHVESHFSMLMGPMFPVLERIVLHGDWTRVVHDPRLRPVYDDLSRRGCSLEYCDGTPVECLVIK